VTVQFLNAASYPTITVEIGVSDTSSAGGTWGQSVWGTGTWTDTIAWTDVSDYVRALSTDWARSRELNRQPANVLNLTLNNRDGRFSPGNTAGPFAVAGVSKIRPRIAVRVRATWSSVTYPIYYGFVTNWQDNLPFVGKDMIATVQATDALSLLTLNAVDGSVIGSNGDSCATRIAAILSAAAWPLGSSLDTAGVTTLTIDSTNDSALSLLQNIAQSDGGLVYADVDGTFTFHYRDHRSLVTRSNTVQIAFGPSDKAYDEPQLSNDETYFYNQVTVVPQGIQSGTSATSLTVGTGSKTFDIQAGLGLAVGNTVLIASTANSANYMQGDITAYSGTSMTVNVTTTGGSGTVAAWNITLVGSVTQTKSDADSVSLYSTRALSVDSWAVNTQAASLALFLRRIYKDPEYRVDSIRVTPAVSAASMWPLVLDAEIDDQHSVTVPLPTTTYVSSFIKYVHVAGISHSIQPATGWTVTFTYSSATPYL